MAASPSPPARTSALDSLRSLPSTTTTARMPGRWSDTVASALGYNYGTARSTATMGTVTAAGASKTRGKQRAAIPFWGGAEAVEGEQERSAREGEATDDAKEELKAARIELDERERELDDLAERILWQAGTDSSTPPGPLLVLSPLQIPPPSSSISHQALLDKLRNRLESFASSDVEDAGYSLVLFATPTPHPPATSLLISSYLALTRVTRKRLRRVWIVTLGGGWWLKVLFTLFTTTLLSRKTARKITQCASLSALASSMGTEAFTPIEIPLEVYAADALVESTISLSPPPSSSSSVDTDTTPSSASPRLFGVALKQLIGSDCEHGLPALVKDCVEVLATKGIDSVGIFRRSPSAATVKILEGAYERGHPVTLSAYPDAPYLAASLLKLFLRSLPTPVFPPSVYPLARACPLRSSSADRSATETYIRTIILPHLPSPTLLLLQQLIYTLSLIAEHHAVTLMDASNLCICIVPNLMASDAGGVSEVELEMCRLPGGVDWVGTVRGALKGDRGGGKREGKKEEGENSLAGVVRSMIEGYATIFDPALLSPLIPEVRPAPTVPLSSSPLTSPTPSTSASLSPRSSRSTFLPISETDEEPYPSLPASPTASRTTPRMRQSFTSISPPTSRRPSLASLYSPATTGSSSSSSASLASLDETFRLPITLARAKSGRVGGQVTVDDGVRGVYARSGEAEGGDDDRAAQEGTTVGEVAAVER